MVMSNPEDCNVTFLQNFFMNIIKTGHIPKHIAFIMDGNRRYAKKAKIDRIEGHRKGFNLLAQVMRWCYSLGTITVTFYTFSIENFKRTKEEVDNLMELLRDLLNNLLGKMDELNKDGISVHVVGRLSLLSQDLQNLSAKLMLATRHNNKLTLNIATAYTARDEISRAAAHIVDGVRSYGLSAEDIDENLVSSSLDLPTVDLLIRTSGEVRLSDFMTWQASNNAVLYFTQVLWPKITIWYLMAAVLHYQRNAPPLCEQKQLTTTQQDFLNKLQYEKWQRTKKMLSLT